MTALDRVLAYGDDAYTASWLQAAYRASRALLQGELSPERREQEQENARAYALEARKRGLKLKRGAPGPICSTTTIPISSSAGDIHVQSVGSSPKGLPRKQVKSKKPLAPAPADGGTLLAQLEASLEATTQDGRDTT